jgi:YegS/Rv2252/BmrU family lipid kinase
LARALVEQGRERILAAGGDGTVLEVSRGLRERGRGTLVILPVGTGNDAARMLGVPRRLSAWLRWFDTAEPTQIDLLELDGRPFVNALGLGLLGAVSERARGLKGVRGPMAYLLAGVQELVRAKAFKMRLASEGFELEAPLLALAIQNGATSGGGFRFCPGAQDCDGKLDVTWVGDLPWWSRTSAILKAYLGQVRRIPMAGWLQLERLEVVTQEPVWIHMDGEPEVLEAGHHEIRVQPQSLWVYAQAAREGG